MHQRRTLPGLLRGPLPALPRLLDAASEKWASLRPRVRVVLTILAVSALVATGELRVVAAESRWGGQAVSVLVAADDLAVGATPDVRSVTFPPSAVPPGAVTHVDSDAVVALAVPQGSVLTEGHLDPAGPAAGLADDMRIVPFSVERGWGVTAGGWVDVWILGSGDDPAVEIASGRPVLELTREDTGNQTALVALALDEVGPATAGIARGRVLLAHTPGP